MKMSATVTPYGIFLLHQSIGLFNGEREGQNQFPMIKEIRK
jgi:hypothetical protein